MPVAGHVRTQAARVHERDLRRAGLRGLRGPPLDLGDQVAQGGLGAAVLGGAVGELAPVERAVDLAQRHGAEHCGLVHRVLRRSRPWPGRTGSSASTSASIRCSWRCTSPGSAAPGSWPSTSPVVGSTVNTSWLRLVPYWPAETTGRSVTARPAHPATGKEQSYARWVWPDTIASTLSLTPVMMLPKSEVGSSSMVAQSVSGAPSCTSRTTTSAPSALRSSAASLVASTMSVTVDARRCHPARPAPAGAR